MLKKLAKLKYLPNNFEILQEAYFSHIEATIKREELLKKT